VKIPSVLRQFWYQSSRINCFLEQSTICCTTTQNPSHTATPSMIHPCVQTNPDLRFTTPPVQPINTQKLTMYRSNYTTMNTRNLRQYGSSLLTQRQWDDQMIYMINQLDALEYRLSQIPPPPLHNKSHPNTHLKWATTTLPNTKGTLSEKPAPIKAPSHTQENPNHPHPIGNHCCSKPKGKQNPTIVICQYPNSNYRPLNLPPSPQ
jgi:hypothetical protein